MEKITINKENSDVYPVLNLTLETGIVTIFTQE